MITQRFQYVVVRYVPNVVRDEGVNVGILVRGVDGDEFAYRFLPRSATVRKLWPTADAQLVANFEKQLQQSRKTGSPVGIVGRPADESFFRRARNEFNGNLQISELRGTRALDLAAAVQWAYDEYVAEPAGGPRPINYQAIAPHQTRQKLWDAFERSHLIGPERVKKALVLQGKHAPWTFDLGYQNGALHLISSVALNAPTTETNLGRALVLRGMVQEVREINEGEVASTAVIQLPSNPSTVSGVPAAQALLRDADIEIVDLKNLTVLVKRVGEALGQHQVTKGQLGRAGTRGARTRQIG